MQLSDQSVYVMAAHDHIKIGVAKDPEKRMRAVQTHIPWTVTLVAVWAVPDGKAFRVEKWAHRLLAEFRVRGEWFRCGLSEVMAHEPKLFSIAFGDTFDAAGDAPAAKSEAYAHSIMRTKRWMTLTEQEVFQDLIQREVWAEHQRMARTVIHSPAWRRKYGCGQEQGNSC